MHEFLENPKKWLTFNINIIIGFLFGVSIPFTAWILLLGYLKFVPFEKSLSIGCTFGLPFGTLLYCLLLYQ